MTRGMDPASSASRCLAALHDGPATTSEVAAEIGRDTKITCAHLTNLVVRGKVTKQPFKPPEGRRCNLWSIRETP